MFKTPLTLGLLTAFTVAPLALQDPVHADVRDIAASTRIPLTDAIQRALSACPGHAVEAELEAETTEDGRDTFYEIMVVGQDGHLHEIVIDPESGEVRSQETEEAEEDEELPGFRTVLRHSELDLAALVAKASELIHGQPVKASLEMDDGQPTCEVLVAHGRYLVEVALEGRAGHVVELELLSDREHRERGEDGEDRDADEDRDDR